MRAFKSVVLVFALCVVILPAGCDQPPTVTSVESQELILRFYTACNTQNPERLKVAKQVFQTLVEEGRISAPEQARFNQLIELADQGRWDQAADKAYAFSQGQVR